jgi:glycerol-3-phosphate acyltransferase PlsY
MPILFRCLACFAMGSIPFAVLSMLGTGIDIRNVGSGNPGFNNVLRVDKRRAALALIGDMGKGFLAVWLVYRHFPASALPHNLDVIALGWIYGFAAVLGHCFSPFLKLNGGKGIATSGGVMLVLYPRWAVVALVYFALTRVILGRRKVREAGTIASLTTWTVFSMLMLSFAGLEDTFYTLVMTMFLTARHKKNIGALLCAPATAIKTRMVNIEDMDAREDSGPHVGTAEKALRDR